MTSFAGSTFPESSGRDLHRSHLFSYLYQMTARTSGSRKFSSRPCQPSPSGAATSPTFVSCGPETPAPLSFETQPARPGAAPSPTFVSGGREPRAPLSFEPDPAGTGHAAATDCCLKRLVKS